VVYSYNFQISEKEQLPSLADSRAFQYGDGLFETIIRQKGEIRFLSWHLQRLHAGMESLAMVNDQGINVQRITQQINKLAELNHLEDCRIKIQLWRKNGGLYTPEDNGVNILISLKALQLPTSFIKPKADFARNIRLAYSAYSFFKSCSALPYVLAGLERKQRQLDELILLDVNGYISECTSSNIFWKKGGQWLTPSLETGCIAGIMRRNILTKLKEKDIAVQEVKALPEELLQAQAVFCCNVTGIYAIEQIEEKRYTGSEAHQELKRFL
jgi:4-amino-4-deoxychorismate lyase